MNSRSVPQGSMRRACQSPTFLPEDKTISHDNGMSIISGAGLAPVLKASKLPSAAHESGLAQEQKKERARALIYRIVYTGLRAVVDDC